MTENKNDNWVTPLAYCEIFIGPHKFAGGVDKKDEGGYSVEINHQDYGIEASSDEESIKVGMARIGEILFDRLSKFEGNPYAFPVIEEEQS
jgi:hypothetical protein